MVDSRDWLGGWPYEYASVGEVSNFVRRRLACTLCNVITTHSLWDNEFLFKRPAE
jgi:hypothetical protein